MSTRNYCEAITRTGKHCSQPIAQRYYIHGIRHCTAKHLNAEDIDILKSKGVDIHGKITPPPSSPLSGERKLSKDVPVRIPRSPKPKAESPELPVMKDPLAELDSPFSNNSSNPGSGSGSGSRSRRSSESSREDSPKETLKESPKELTTKELASITLILVQLCEKLVKDKDKELSDGTIRNLLIPSARKIVGVLNKNTITINELSGSQLSNNTLHRLLGMVETQQSGNEKQETKN